MALENHNLNLQRTLNAPVERVWQAWTDPQEVQKWWGPAGVTNPTCTWEPAPGGKIEIVMLAGPELGEMAGQEWPMTGQFQEVVPQQKLVFTSSAIMDGKEMLQTSTTVTFEPAGGQTNLTVEVVVTKTTPEAAFALQGMEQGWNQQLDKLGGNVTA